MFRSDFNLQTLLKLIFIGSIILFISRFSIARQHYNRELNFSIRINFGVKGRKPLVWDGNASINEGKILGIRGFRFDENDALIPEENRWRCSIERLRGWEYAENLEPGTSVREFLEELKSKGIELDIRGRSDSSLTISTSAGNFSFPLSDLVVGRKIEFLEGNLRIELIPRPHNIPKKGKGEIENYTTLCSDYEGNMWVAWVSFSNGKEEMLISKFNGKRWDNPYVVDKGKEGFLTPALACKPDGTLFIVWPAKKKGDWELFVREYNNKKGRWTSTTQLTKNPGADIHPVMAVDKMDKLYLCWQGVRDSNEEIFLMINDKKGWNKPVQVTEYPGNDWEPDIAVNPQGTVIIAWEGFRDGLHKILAREFIRGGFRPERIITSSKNYVAHASLCSDMEGRFWIAWDEAGEDWGFGEEEEVRTVSINKFDEVKTQIDYDKVAIVGRRGRYNSRALQLACLQGGKLYRALHDPFENLPAPMKMYADLPKLISDQQGRLWIIFHHYVGRVPFYVHNQQMEIWKVYAIYYNGLAWSDPIVMPHNTWRQFSAASACLDQSGHLWTAYIHDGRQTGNRDVDTPNISVSSLALPTGDLVSVPVKPLTQKAYDREKGEEPKNPYYVTDLGKKGYTLYWGSLHDLHDVRGRMSLDGFVIDSFKYAMDDWGYDFLGLKDYVYRNDSHFTDKNYSWREVQKAIDLFSIKDSFISFFLKGKSPYLRVPGHSLLKKRPPKGVPIIMGVYADALTKDALIDAIEKRRQYLATDKILLDFWVAGHPMGDKFKCADRFPKMEARAIGTDKLKRVDIIRNAECIYSTVPNSSKARFTFIDTGLNPNEPGEYHYFLLIEQENGRMAWSPPACLHYFPGYDK